MPADYFSTAQGLAVSSDPGSPTDHRADPPLPWVRPARSNTSSSARRLSSARFSVSRSASSRPLFARLARRADALARQAWAFWSALPLWQRALAGLGLALAAAAGVLFLIYSHRIFAWLGPAAARWRAAPGGWLVIWLVTFVTAFPPVIGYSTAVSVAGFVWGFPLGWPIVATANVAGSLAAFVASRTVFSAYVHRLVGRDHRFVALGQVLRRDGLGVLTMIRFCPLPYSLSNGFLATIPSITPWAFAASTALASPKLLVHVFIGSRLALLANQGDTMSAGDKAVNYISMALGGLFGLGVGVVIYNRTMARAEELAREEAQGLTAGDGDGEAGDYDDLEAGLLGPEDAAALMDDDDISLWETDGLDDDGYRDEPGVGVGGKKTAADGDVPIENGRDKPVR